MTDEYETEIVDFLMSYLGSHINSKLKRLPLMGDNAENIRLSLSKPIISKQKSMELESGIYSPRCDIAIGPYAYKPGNSNPLFDSLLDQVSINLFLSRLAEFGEFIGDDSPFLNDGLKLQNINPRCFISIEIEDRTNRKHFMGSVLNCSIMGKIGIIISYNPSDKDYLFRYIKEMILREKIPPILRNVLWITKQNFDKFMSLYARNSQTPN